MIGNRITLDDLGERSSHKTKAKSASEIALAALARANQRIKSDHPDRALQGAAPDRGERSLIPPSRRSRSVVPEAADASDLARARALLEHVLDDARDEPSFEVAERSPDGREAAARDALVYVDMDLVAVRTGTLMIPIFSVLQRCRKSSILAETQRDPELLPRDVRRPRGATADDVLERDQTQ